MKATTDQNKLENAKGENGANHGLCLFIESIPPEGWLAGDVRVAQSYLLKCHGSDKVKNTGALLWSEGGSPAQ
ncbi:MAG: hypothetical protein WCL44_03270 [bacterium]